MAMNEREFDFSLQVSTSESKPHSTTLLTVTLCDPGMATTTYFIRKLFNNSQGVIVAIYQFANNAIIADPFALVIK